MHGVDFPLEKSWVSRRIVGFRKYVAERNGGKIGGRLRPFRRGVF